MRVDLPEAVTKIAFRPLVVEWEKGRPNDT
jgi:hypothetical protein